ncbi:ribosomal RNA small subunit methyltransferase A [Candidatus Uhrbacteria bacterium RIFCSPHIGHO2_12_FULL_60_25]|uniref:Ribosomal RNA small subunit methyltransferase A n=1 Tax=Candidatus Uhrbacteria bacterium RIFCSPHIGHO2_12_FULL_60_25 TaxID=1802399 RepID=A0A1F7UPE4_9BACT|nr:MAG: ribosomal RNA small subunit methyltransferase A [Candidatus Uhrbacteria bacterium RIFCSPHIGHO2_02_FULL_60_44]OGL79624.1 MAG: ribosomal RNA small subunit methyltransferase A [Candidatus Uhrbacteria bacterium RIFCSPHIGHO2_12_FULL_60_25]
MSPAEIKATLTRLGVRPNKRLGQHFLIDRAALQAIVEAADLKRGDVVLEVGPGLGVLTGALLDHGARVTAIEQDRTFVAYLEKIYPDLTVSHGDAATIHWHDIVGVKPWKFVSNLPYSITSLALRKALWAPRPADRVVVLVQREVAERAVARSGKTSLLSLMVALASRSARIIRRVPAGAFYPPPKVESAVLEIVPMPWSDREKRWGIDPEKVMEVAKRGFAHPRKQLASNLASPLHVLAQRAAPVQGKEAVVSVLVSLGLDPKTRAEDLSPDEWAKLTIALH